MTQKFDQLVHHNRPIRLPGGGADLVGDHLGRHDDHRLIVVANHHRRAPAIGCNLGVVDGMDRDRQQTVGIVPIIAQHPHPRIGLGLTRIKLHRLRGDGGVIDVRLRPSDRRIGRRLVDRTPDYRHRPRAGDIKVNHESNGAFMLPFGMIGHRGLNADERPGSRWLVDGGGVGRRGVVGNNRERLTIGI